MYRVCHKLPTAITFTLTEGVKEIIVHWVYSNFITQEEANESMLNLEIGGYNYVLETRPGHYRNFAEYMCAMNSR